MDSVIDDDSEALPKALLGSHLCYNNHEVPEESSVLRSCLREASETLTVFGDDQEMHRCDRVYVTECQTL